MDGTDDGSARIDGDARPTDAPDGGRSRALGRRRLLQSAAAATALGTIGRVAAGSRVTPEEDDDEFPPVPEIPEKGYFVEEIRDDLYWVTDGGYLVMFLVSEAGVIVVDAPPTLTRSVLAAIEETTDRPITHVVYSHYHADHIAGASLYPDDAEYVAHDRTARELAHVDTAFTTNRPEPTTTFEGSYTLEVGDQRLELDYRGANHTPDNTFVYAPDQKVLMAVDIVFPGVAPAGRLAFSKDIPGWIEAHDEILRYDFDRLVAGHFNRLGVPEDVRIQREYVTDLRDNVAQALRTVRLGPIVREVNPQGTLGQFELFETYTETVVERATEATLEKWRGELLGVEKVTASHASALFESLRLDYGILGPFGLPGS